MAEALAEALDGLDKFDPAALSDHAVVVATVSFVEEIVLTNILAEQGNSAVSVPGAQAVARENAIRDLVHELTDLQATPRIQAMSGRAAPQVIETVIKDITAAVMREMGKW